MMFPAIGSYGNWTVSDLMIATPVSLVDVPAD